MGSPNFQNSSERKAPSSARPVTHVKEPGWRSMILVWVWNVISVLLVNVIFLLWASTREAPQRLEQDWDSNPPDAETILYQGDCQTASRIKIGIHLVINVLSSLLLTASAACMQCLGSLSRTEIDEEHDRGRTVNIGVLSLGNLARIPKPRLLLWTVLALSSLPLHLFYNSAIYTILGARDVYTFLASSDFYASPLNETSIASLAERNRYSSNQLIVMVQQTMPGQDSYSAAQLDPDECLAAFSQSVVSSYKTLTVILTVAGQPQILDISYARGNSQRQAWTCYDEGCIAMSDDFSGTTLQFLGCCGNRQSSNGAGDTSTFGDILSFRYGASTTYDEQDDYENDPLRNHEWAVSSCQAVPAEGHCTVSLAAPLLIVVIVANMLKAGAMIATLGLSKFDPIVTIGDAVRSFLSRPDPSTQDSTCSIQASTSLGKDLPAGRYSRAVTAVDTDQSNIFPKFGSRRWAASATRKQWSLTIGLCIFLEIAAAVFLWLAISPEATGHVENQFASDLASGWGAIRPESIYIIEATSLVGLSALSNTFQILVSLVYVLYNSLFGTMIVAAEMAAFSIRPKALRVSPPRHGQQRSTYWLNMPLRYAAPVLVAMTLLHWFISEALFVVKIDQITQKEKIKYAMVQGLGYSSPAIVASMAWGAVIIRIPVVLGFKRLKTAAPVLSLNSRAIAAACHPRKGETDKLEELPLLYGLLAAENEYEMRRWGFGNAKVESLASEAGAKKRGWGAIQNWSRGKGYTQNDYVESIEMEQGNNMMGKAVTRPRPMRHDTDSERLLSSAARSDQ